ncbi:MAG TPA: AarF/UbiB family protein, partial [Syntrophothermus lipocalidus]|nr:AarF/UbiB family protein [Syntrophothermus lipocalidus]
STRPDLLPAEYIRQLEKLQDSVPPFPFNQVQQVLDEEGLKKEDIFASFSEKPLASASIGQVHEAVLKTGEKVVVKVQRPGISKIIENDLE